MGDYSSRLLESARSDNTQRRVGALHLTKKPVPEHFDLSLTSVALLICEGIDNFGWRLIAE
jgi:hypothetical protein